MSQDIGHREVGVPPSATRRASLVTDQITKSYGSTQVLEELSLRVDVGEFVSLLGPSGCGKTTTLNIVSGFVSPDSGTVLIDDKDVTKAPAHKRDSSVVFQNYALFPHLTVEKNIKYGLKAKRTPTAEMDERLAWALRLVDIEDLRDRYPGQLSGGQQQRVAVARSLVMRPGILLMDEPFSNLDAKLRGELRLELKTLQRELQQSVLFVTHDQLEALSLSDRIVVMNEGRVEQVGSPREVYESPRTVFVAQFLGVENTFDVLSDGDCYVTASQLTFQRSLLDRPCAAIGVRPSSVRLLQAPSDVAQVWRSEGVVKSMTYLGDSVRYEVLVSSETIVAILPGTTHVFEVGERVHLEVPASALLALAP